MTSLIFGAIYMGHQGLVHHHRDKQRQKNYERWEGLRDEYDEQKKITRQTRSLDIQRTGQGSEWEEPREILTLRDQQEANDARTSWRPQESWEIQSHGAGLPAENVVPQRHASVNYPITSQQSQQRMYNIGGIKRQTTGATWDADLPEPLRVSRMSYDDTEHRSPLSALNETGRAESPRRSSAMGTPFTGVSRSGSVSGSRVGSGRASPVVHEPRTSSVLNPNVRSNNPFETMAPGKSNNPFEAMAAAETKNPFSVEAVEHPVAGGPMAQLIERGW